MTQMTLMTLNPGYGIGYPQNSVISVICVTIVTQEQRGGLGYTPEMCMWMTTCYASKTYLPPKRW